MKPVLTILLIALSFPLWGQVFFRWQLQPILPFYAAEVETPKFLNGLLDGRHSRGAAGVLSGDLLRIDLEATYKEALVPFSEFFRPAGSEKLYYAARGACSRSWGGRFELLGTYYITFNFEERPSLLVVDTQRRIWHFHENVKLTGGFEQRLEVMDSASPVWVLPVAAR